MKFLTILSVIIVLNACSKPNNPIETTIPNCIQDIIENPNLSVDLQTIRVQEVDKELHYWLNTDYAHSDGVEYIVNSSCDTICAFCGECFPAECAENYNESWIPIWEK